MINVGLTGNRYSGKDRVCRLFEQISIPVFNADIVLKFILQYNVEIDRQIKIQLGSSIYDKTGHIDPTKLNTSEKFDRLIEIAEDELFKSYEKFKLKYPESIYTIFHSSILFERKWDKKMDSTICIFAPKVERVERAKKHESQLLTSVIWDLTSKEIEDLDKNKAANYVIHNYEDATNILKQVDNIDGQIIDKYLKSEQTVQKSKKVYPL